MKMIFHQRRSCRANLNMRRVIGEPSLSNMSSASMFLLEINEANDNEQISRVDYLDDSHM